MESIEPLDTPDDEELSSVAALAAEQRAAEQRVAAIKLELAMAEQELAALRDDQLPKAMLALGLSDFTLTDGAKVVVRDHYRCGQLDDGPQKEGGRPLEERLGALRWLDNNGHGDLARRVITVTLGAGSEKLAAEILALIRSHRASNSLQIDARRTVPWNTLSAFAREQMGQHEDPPLELLGVTIQSSAKITPPKPKGDF